MKKCDKSVTFLKICDVFEMIFSSGFADFVKSVTKKCHSVTFLKKSVTPSKPVTMRVAEIL